MEPLPALFTRRHHDEALIVFIFDPLYIALLHEAVHRPGGRGWGDVERFGEFPHSQRAPLAKHRERVG